MKSKKLQIKFYLLFIIFAIIINTIIETTVVRLGIVNYTIDPKLFGISWFTYFLYFPWILVTYEVGNFLNRKSKIQRYIFYFIIGALFAFCIDLYATSVNWYFYRFNSIFNIANVPLEDFFAVGLMIASSVSISEYFVKKITNI